MFTIVDNMAAASLAAQRLPAFKFPCLTARPLAELRRFHRDIGLHPDFMPDASEPVRLVLSQHAIRGAQREMERKHVAVFIPTVIDFSKVVLVEQGVYENELDRVLVRQRHDDCWDLVMSISMRGKSLWLITAWLNRCSDRHKTLDKSLYEKP